MEKCHKAYSFHPQTKFSYGKVVHFSITYPVSQQNLIFL